MTKPVRFTQADIARALKAAQSAGFDAVRVVLEPDGKIVIMTGRLAEKGEANPWDE